MIEKNQELSVLNLLDERELIQTSDLFGEEKDILSNYSAGAKETSLLEKIIYYLYRISDYLSGSNALSLTNAHVSISKFQKILGFLKKTDLIENVSVELRKYNDAPGFYFASIKHKAATVKTNGKKLNTAVAFSNGKNLETVLAKSMGEFLERIPLATYDYSDFIVASEERLAKKRIPFVKIDELSVFSDYQRGNFSAFKYDSRSVFAWEKCVKAATGEKILIPAQLIYWNYKRGREPVLRESNTNGMGGMTDKEGAILSALYEIIQRDAFLIFWLNKIAPPQINPDSVPGEEFKNILSESKKYGFKIFCLNTTFDTAIPSFAVVIMDEKNIYSTISVGGGCETDPAKALLQALQEAWAVYYWMRRVEPYSLLPSYEPFRTRLNRAERLRLWANPEMADKFTFFLKGEEKQFSDIDFNYPAKFNSSTEELNFAVKRVENARDGCEVYYYLAKHFILSSTNYYSARVVVPQLVPLYLDERFVPLGLERLKDISKISGADISGGFNELPHPFP